MSETTEVPQEEQELKDSSFSQIPTEENFGSAAEDAVEAVEKQSPANDEILEILGADVEYDKGNADVDGESESTVDESEIKPLFTENQKIELFKDLEYAGLNSATEEEFENFSDDELGDMLDTLLEDFPHIRAERYENEMFGESGTVMEGIKRKARGELEQSLAGRSLDEEYQQYLEEHPDLSADSISQEQFKTVFFNQELNRIARERMQYYYQQNISSEEDFIQLVHELIGDEVDETQIKSETDALRKSLSQTDSEGFTEDSKSGNLAEKLPEEVKDLWPWGRQALDATNFGEFLKMLFTWTAQTSYGSEWFRPEQNESRKPFGVKEFEAAIEKSASNKRERYVLTFNELHEQLKKQDIEVGGDDKLWEAKVVDDESIQTKAKHIHRAILRAGQNQQHNMLHSAFQKTMEEIGSAHSFTKNNYLSNELVAHFGYIADSTSELRAKLGRE